MSRLLLAAGVACVLVLGAAAAAGAADSTPPQVTFQLVGTEGQGGWYVTPTTVRWQVADPESGIKSTSGCEPATTVGETTGTKLTCSATNFADTTTSVTVVVRVDTTPPAVTGATPDRPPNTHGWYTQPIRFTYSGTDATSGVAGCSVVTYAGPDSGDATVNGTCTDAAGNVSAPSTTGFRYDATPPAMTGATPDRPPNTDGWYTQAIRFTYSGTDTTSGVAGCSVVTYAGPDSGAATVNGTCTDAAGNVSAPITTGFRYDATPPALRGVTARAGDGQVTVAWSPLSGSDWVDVSRAVDGSKAAARTIYHGDAASVVDRQAENGVHYRYAVIAHDKAGHVVEVAVPAMPLGAMRTPPPGARIDAAPTLSWRATPGAALYNVQLFRGARKVLSAWPRSAALRLASRWTYAGRSHRLTPGTYRWYVWPAYRSGKRYRFGKLVGRSSFVVTS